MPLQQPDGFRPDGNLKAVSDNRYISYGTTEPIIKSAGDLWFEAGAVFPQPWEWNAAEQTWLSSPFVLDWGYTSFTLNSQTSESWTNRTAPFYGVTANRIRLDAVFGTIFNVGTAAHTLSTASTSLFADITLDRFLGSATMTRTVVVTPDTQGMAAATYSTQASPESNSSVPNAASLKRITMTNLNLWLPGNTWFQRMIVRRRGSSTVTSGVSIAVALIQILRFSRGVA